MTSFERRRLLLGCGSLALVGLPNIAWAGSYLDRASLLVNETRREMQFLQGHTHDQDSAKLVHSLTTDRVKAVNHMTVPEEVIQAHPHLLLMLENAERAANALVQKQAKSFGHFLRLVRDEEGLFISILKQLGWRLPNVS